jgi:hypothetical protein
MIPWIHARTCDASHMGMVEIVLNLFSQIFLDRRPEAIGCIPM